MNLAKQMAWAMHRFDSALILRLLIGIRVSIRVAGHIEAKPKVKRRYYSALTLRLQVDLRPRSAFLGI
jgi:hypothetical protein